MGPADQCRHEEQWQNPIASGAPWTWISTAPQKQLPLYSFWLGIRSSWLPAPVVESGTSDPSCGHPHQAGAALGDPLYAARAPNENDCTSSTHDRASAAADERRQWAFVAPPGRGCPFAMPVSPRWVPYASRSRLACASRKPCSQLPRRGARSP